MVTDFNSPRIVNAYDELPLWSAMFGLLLLKHVPLANVRRVLDIGCGTGFPAIELAERLGSDARVYGLDTWQMALHRAAEKIANRGTPHVTMINGTASQLPFADGVFDLIVSNLGVNNFDDPVAVVRECRRVSCRGATIALTTNLQGHMQELYAVFERVLQKRADDAALDRLRAHIDHRATVERVRDLLEGAGFTITNIVQCAEEMRFRSGTALINHHFIKLGFLDGWKSVAGDDPSVFDELVTTLNAAAHERDGLRLTIPVAYIQACV